MTEPHYAAFVDTNVLVYAFEKGSSAKKTTAERLLSRLMQAGDLRLSTQVLQELFVRLTHVVRGTCSMEEALRRLEDLTRWPIFVVDYPAIRHACLVAHDSALSFWDALIVVAAARSGASHLYTEDLNHGQKILGVEVANPFLQQV